MFKLSVIHLCSCQLCVMVDSVAHLRAAHLNGHDWSHSVSSWHLEQTDNTSLHIQIQEKNSKSRGTNDICCKDTFQAWLETFLEAFPWVTFTLCFLNAFSNLTFRLSLRHYYLLIWSDQYTCSTGPIITSQSFLHLDSKILQKVFKKTELFWQTYAHPMLHPSFIPIAQAVSFSYRAPSSKWVLL